MTEGEARQILRAILDGLEIRPGDTVFLGIDIGGMPLPNWPAAIDRTAIRNRAQAWCKFVFDGLMESIGTDGTLLLPAFSYAYARAGEPYIHETSPAETGPFCEYVRRRPESIRSLHPLNSIAGLGRVAQEILGPVGKAGYGACSPFARLNAHATKFLFLGAPLGISLTYAHHMEHMYGVNHMYHKLYNTQVLRDGIEQPGPWLCFVRYLGADIEPRIGNLEDRLREDGSLREYKDWPSPMQCVDIADVERVGYEMLCRSPWAFLADPVEIHTDAPGAIEQPAVERARRLAFVS